MYQVKYKNRFYSRLQVEDENGNEIKYPNLTTDDVIKINYEHDLFAIRAKRNQLIAETDWTQLTDSPLSEDKKAEFAQYRQALRDLPQTMDLETDEIVWLKPPELPINKTIK